MELKKSNPELKIGLRVDKKVTMDKLIEIMNLCKKSGIVLKLETSE